jgi:membrane peptidoglycan carboxypeptidase
VWIGYKDSLKPLRNLKGFRGGITGGSLPALTWKRFMDQALLGQPIIPFEKPVKLQSAEKLSRQELLRRRARGGIDLGKQRSPEQLNGRSFVQDGVLPPLPEDGSSFGVTATTTTSVTTTTLAPVVAPPEPVPVPVTEPPAPETAPPAPPPELVPAPSAPSGDAVVPIPGPIAVGPPAG